MGTPKWSPHLKSLRETGRGQGMYLNPRMVRSGDRWGKGCQTHLLGAFGAHLQQLRLETPLWGVQQGGAHGQALCCKDNPPELLLKGILSRLGHGKSSLPQL